MNCKKCNQPHCIKTGKRNGRQSYHCKNCKHNFQDNYTYNAYKLTTNVWIARLLKNSCGVMDVSRILEISPKTVLSRILKISKQIKIPYFNKRGCMFEVNEMFMRIENKETKNYLTYAIERKTKDIIGFIVGSRNTENLKSVIDKLLLLNPKRVYTDGLNIYPSLIPKEIHKRFQYCTNRIEL